MAAAKPPVVNTTGYDFLGTGGEGLSNTYTPTTPTTVANPYKIQRPDPVTQANLNYYNKASASGDSNPLPGETAQAFAIRRKTAGAGIYVDPIEGETAAQFKARNQAAAMQHAKNAPANNTSVLGDTGLILGDVARTVTNPTRIIGSHLPDGVEVALNPVGAGLDYGMGKGLAQIPGAGSNTGDSALDTVVGSPEVGGIMDWLGDKPGTLDPGPKPGAGGGYSSGGAGVNPELQSYIDQTLAAGATQRQVDPYAGMLDYNPYTENEGPSKAEALLKTALEQRTGDALGLAATTRGGPGAVARAQRQARAQNAAGQQRTAADLVALRAQEENDRRQRLLEGYTSERNRYSTERTTRTVADINAETADLSRQLDAAKSAGDIVAEQLIRDKINANSLEVADLNGWWDSKNQADRINAGAPSNLEKLVGGTTEGLKLLETLGLL